MAILSTVNIIQTLLAGTKFDLLGGLPNPRGIATQIFKPLTQMDISANEIIRGMRAAGLGYRRQDMLRDIAQWSGYWEHREAYKNVQGGSTFPEDQMIRSFNMPEGKRYLYKGIGTFETTGGETFERYISIYADENLNEGDLEAELNSRFGGGWQASAQAVLLSFQRRLVYHNERMGHNNPY